MVAVLPLLALVLAAASPAPWEGEPFAGDAKAIAEAAAKLPPGRADASTDLLLEEVAIVLDDAGRATRTQRYVYVLRSPEAARAWAVRYEYTPWYEAKPEIRARVVTATGVERWLDAATLIESGVSEESGLVYSDRKALRAPLPGVAPGAIVEETAVMREIAPFFEAGTVHTAWMLRPDPVRRVRIRIDAPASYAATLRVRDLPEPRTTTAGSRVAHSWDLEDLPGVAAPEPFTPPDQLPARGAAVTTGRSWADVARAYAALVERQLAGADLVATARAVVGKRDSPEVAAQKVLSWIHARVRYTGLSVGDAAILPARPAETLARGFGDCKDLSTLAVGLLRAAGHDASVALVDTGNDPDPELPGLGVFDHAIVRVGRSAPIWLDPADRWAAAGELGPSVQGRLALVAEPATTGLVRTREAPPGEDRWVKVRTLELREEDWTAAREEGEFWGLAAAHVAAAADGLAGEEGAKAARERLVAAGEGAKGSAKVTIREGGRSGTARLVLEIADSRWGFTGDDDAAAIVPADHVFQRLPDLFPLVEAADGARRTPPPRRKADLLLPEAYHAELRYRVVPPLGFRATALPEGERVELGPASYEVSFALDKEGAVVAIHRFALSKRRLSPAEVETLWTAVEERTRGDGARLRFERVSSALLAAGKRKEALAELRRLLALHPREALHHRLYAAALLQVGMGEDARAAARRAAELEPGSTWAHIVLSRALQHDLVGRRYGAGWDREGAIDALRKARDLSPRDAGLRGELALLLEHAPNGERFGPGANLDEAIAELRHAVGELGDRQLGVELARALLRKGDVRGASAAARAAPKSASRHALVIVATAIEEGADGAVREAMALDPETRLTAVQQAGVELIQERRYALAAEVYARGATGTTASADLRRFGDLLRQVRPLALEGEPRDAAAVPAHLFQALISPNSDAALASLLGVDVKPEDTAGFREVFRTLSPAAREIGPTFLVDAAASLLRVDVDGEGPWRVQLRFQNPISRKEHGNVLLVRREGGKLRIAGWNPTRSRLGAEAMRLLAAGDLAAAKRVLEWTRPRNAGSGGPSVTSVSSIVPLLLTSGAGADREEVLRCAAALAAYEKPTPGDVTGVLEAERARARGEPREVLSLALLMALEDSAPPERALALADEVGAESPRLADAASVARGAAFARAKRWKEVRAIAEERLRASPDELWSLRALVQALSQSGDARGASEARWRVARAKGATSNDLNVAAWSELFGGAPRPETLETAERAVELAGSGAADALHTLAAVQAALDRPAEAMDALHRATALRGAVVPEDWVIVGRVAASLGLAETAARSYARVTTQHRDPLDTRLLADRWARDLERGRARRE
jgi:tetratricopeptide (TPR) repeat protein/transglutaminase-like putative cysteine protease